MFCTLTHSANVHPLVRLLRAFINKSGEALFADSSLQTMLGIFQKLVPRKVCVVCMLVSMFSCVISCLCSCQCFSCELEFVFRKCAGVYVR